MSEFDFFSEYLKFQARTSKSVKLVKITEVYYEKLKVSIGVGNIIGIPFEINNDQSDDFKFIC